MRPIAAIVLALSFVGAAELFAHDTWLLPSISRARVGEEITFSLTSGDDFPVDDFTIDPRRVVRAVSRLNGVTAALTERTSTPNALQFRWRGDRAGLATVGVALAPRTLILAPDKIAEYLDEIDADRSIRDAWRIMASPQRRWRESYVKHAKTFVRIGERTADSSWLIPMGLKLELVPTRDPTSLRAGDTLVVRVLESGIALAGFAVGAIPAGAPTAKFYRTNSRGEAALILPAAGAWLLNGTHLRRSMRAGLEWESDFTTLTIEVARSK